jgi:hypothetical protein
MSERTSIFATSSGVSDVSDFTPKARPVDRPSPDDIDKATVGSRFKSREAPTEPTVNSENTKRLPMVYRTGRNVVFSAKTTKEMVSRFYALAETNGWKAGETFERAVEALERESTTHD